MVQLLRIELFKIFKRPRTYISFGIVASIALLIQLAIKASGKEFAGFMMQGVSENFSIQGNVLNGYLVTYITLNLLLVHVPLLVALVAADEIAGEANLGTLRLLLSKPISRGKFVIAKFIASTIYSFLLLVWLAIIGLGLSLLIFGDGDMINLKSDAFILILRNDILWRYFAAFAFAALAMTVVCSLALLLSVFADNSIGPIISTMGIVIFLTIITNLGLPVFDTIKPWLFTTHMIAWKGFFDAPVPWHPIGISALVLVAYIILFVAITVVAFTRKDIRS